MANRVVHSFGFEEGNKNNMMKTVKSEGIQVLYAI